MESNDSPFYVYTLTDPRNGEVFYVGKGRRRRAWQHTAVARTRTFRSNPWKDQRILEILEDRREPAVNIIERFENEHDALAFETSLISKTPNLTNSNTARRAHMKQFRKERARHPSKYLSNGLTLTPWC